MQRGHSIWAAPYIHQHTPTLSAPAHTPHTCAEPGQSQLTPHHTSLPLVGRWCSPTGRAYLWCQTTRGWSFAAWTPHPQSQPPCRFPWLWSCRTARQRAAGLWRREADGSTRCEGGLWTTSGDVRCLSLWSGETRHSLLVKEGKPAIMHMYLMYHELKFLFMWEVWQP